MIVYGDPQTTESLNSLVARLTAVLARTSSPISLDLARELLVRAGQLEQAVDDAQPALDTRVRADVHMVTELLADVFTCAWKQIDGESAASLSQAHRLLVRLNASDQAVTVKIPEGFAFYALYPEQYLASAQSWLRAHGSDNERSVMVIGLRSIGTTLSALVKAAFRHEGWQVKRFTVRPSGHPYERKVELPAAHFPAEWWWIVVDEGPGASGSSFVAVADALMAAGVAHERITFFPGHNGDPGSGANDHVRACWQTIQRTFTPLSDLSFGGLELTQALGAKTAELLGGEVKAIQDFGGGLWREAAYPNTDDMPVAYIPFERPKTCVTLSNGERVLWKFAGFAATPKSELSTAASAMHRLQRRFFVGDTPQPFGQFHGFVAQQWSEGKRLRCQNATPEFLTQLARYTIRSSGALLTPIEQLAGITRLREMLYWNTWELLGEGAAERTKCWRQITAPLQRYGDGRLDPCEWLITPVGGIFKTDCAGHDFDHTVVGQQSILWDIAGALVEWTDNPQSALPLISAAQRAFGEEFNQQSLHFYQAAYAAFRGGMCVMCAQQSEGLDQSRLWQTAERYRQVLRKMLEC